MRKIFFYPISMLWSLLMTIRRKFYNSNGGKRRVTFQKPIICVGNLCMGGSGKTPHTEYLIRLLSSKYQLAILSRGYKRKTNGFMFADSFSSSTSIGDEPYLYYKKYTSLAVAVSENRVEGVRKIYEKLPEVDVIVLDDAYQHLRLKAGLNILLTDYYNLYADDYVFPSGNLRESVAAAKEADIIIITKSPSVISPIDERITLDKLKPLPHQQVFFSFIRYGNLVPFTTLAKMQIEEPKSVVVFTGIYNPYPLIQYFKEKYKDIQIYTCRDHHQYTKKDMMELQYLLSRCISPHKTVITTEKDAVRLLEDSIKELAFSMPIHYIPIAVDFHEKYKENFDNKIKEYVESYQ
ncbi:MAG TPA: tetraacyldisaccharide 4'-kinase [Bacteroidales bacterium]|jgi:tetraacyldisaccharide 4'-kinase|nr:tetraacyldisaccharide 4'-kinase [Bacteroidales bacterium]HOF16452.1 tetraacyldisaccharide 4'-kinase [Bacteroidales bacterium]HOR81385.1 tetraacyldisaccharide 4'-kinase [Bacteroidales bacterium]HPJ91756.1 tetraacyldisaccharide 4'-kinase [Bacteroidales bacterium]